MKIGVCMSGKTEHIAAAKENALDYCEVNFGRLATIDAQTFATMKADLAAAGLQAEASNGLLCPGLNVVGEDVDRDAYQKHLEAGFARLAALGGRISVFGSGAQRCIPEGMDAGTGRGQFVRAVRMAAAEAAKYGITVAIEPLRQEETNLICTVREGVALARQINLPNVKVIADVYHMYCGGEGPEVLREVAADIAHVHVCKTDRTAPVDAEGRDWCRTLAEVLREIGYTGRVSLECTHSLPFAQSVAASMPALAYFK